MTDDGGDASTAGVGCGQAGSKSCGEDEENHDELVPPASSPDEASSPLESPPTRIVPFLHEPHNLLPAPAHDIEATAPPRQVTGDPLPTPQRSSLRYPRKFIRQVRDDTLLRNSLFIMASTVVTSALGYVFWLVAARLYNASVVGLTAAITSAGTIILLVASVGVGGTLIQSLPGQRNRPGWSATFWAGLATAALFAASLSVVAAFLLPLLSTDLTVLRSVGYAAVFVVGTVTLALGATLDYVFLSDRKGSAYFNRNLAVAVVKVVMLVLLGWKAGPDALSLLGAWGVASVLGVAFGAALLIHYVHIPRPPRISVLFRTVADFRSSVTGHQLIGMGVGLLPYLLPLLVTARLSADDNAYFFTTWMLAGLLSVVSGAVSQSLFAEGSNQPAALGSMARSAAKIIGVTLLPGLVLILGFGGMLLAAFGQAYADNAVDLLRIAAVASIPDAVTNVYVEVLRVQGRRTAAALLNLGMGSGVLVISWILLPVLGISAVGWSYLAMQLAGCVFIAIDRGIAKFRSENSNGGIEESR